MTRKLRVEYPGALVGMQKPEKGLRDNETTDY
jgi:hypothetical protein